MRNILALSIVMTTLLLFFVSCADDSPTGANKQVDAQFETTTDIVIATDEFLSLSTFTYSMSQFLTTLGKPGAPTDTLFPGILTCPYIITDEASNGFRFDFGTGCTDQNGLTHSGTINVNISGDFQTSGTLTMNFDNYEVDGQGFSGTITLSVSNGTTIQYLIDNASIAGPDGTFLVNADLALEVELNTPAEFLDDVYLLTGSFAIDEVDGGANFMVAITDPIRIETDCDFPTSGKATVSGGDDSGDFSATVDYFPENGACDDIVEVTIAGTTRKIHLQ